MRTIQFIVLFLVASCDFVLCAEPPARVAAFSKLNQGDTLTVHFHTSGCFHEATYDFTFRRASELSVSIVQLPRELSRSGLFAAVTNRVDMGSLTLSQSEVAGLDRLMKFYRSEHHNQCTTVNKLTFTQMRDGKTVATEQITDGSCQTGEMKRVTTFTQLIGRLSSPKQ